MPNAEESIPMKTMQSYPAHLVPPPLPNLGELIKEPLTGSKFRFFFFSPQMNRHQKKKNEKDILRDYQPKGILVAHLPEHQGCINQLAVSADNLFFVSCSDDGTVKIW